MKRHIYNIGAAASIATMLALTACTVDDVATTTPDPTDPAVTPLSFAAHVPEAFGTLTGSRGFNETSALSDLTLNYDNGIFRNDYIVPAGNITQVAGDDNSFSFHTKPNSTAGLTGLSKEGLFWDNINSNGDVATRFFLTAQKAEQVGNSKQYWPLWGTCLYTPSTTAGNGGMNRSDRFDFGTMHYRQSKLTVVVKPGSGRTELDALKLKVTMDVSDTRTGNYLAYVSSMEAKNFKPITIIKQERSTTETSIMVASRQGSTAVMCYNPAAALLTGEGADSKDAKHLTLWYDLNNDGDTEDAGEKFSIDLSTLAVTRDATSPFNPNGTGEVWHYNTEAPNTPLTEVEYDNMGAFLFGKQRFNATATQFAFNPGEHITLNVTLNISSGALGLDRVTVNAFTIEDEGSINVKPGNN